MVKDNAPVEPVGPRGDASGDPRRWWHRRRWQVALVGVVTLALVAGVGGFLFWRHLDGNLTVRDYEGLLTDRPTNEVVEGPSEPLDVLIMGSDTREGAGNAIDRVGEDSQRADTTILMHLSADRERAYGVSLPRDALVTRPDCTTEDGETIPGAERAIFNSAYAVGGAACAIQTVEQLTGVRIEHHVELDFAGFRTMVDALGGVEVCIPREVDDPDKGIFLEAGVQELDGDAALDYVRERSQLSVNADIGRMRRQQAFIASMANKIVSADMLVRPDRLVRFLDAATSSLTIDEDLGGVLDLAALARQFSDIGLENITFVTAPFVEAREFGRLRLTKRAEVLWALMRADRPLGDFGGEDQITAADRPGVPDRDPGPSVGPVLPSESPSAGATEEPELEATADGLCA